MPILDSLSRFAAHPFRKPQGVRYREFAVLRKVRIGADHREARLMPDTWSRLKQNRKGSKSGEWRRKRSSGTVLGVDYAAPVLGDYK